MHQQNKHQRSNTRTRLIERLESRQLLNSYYVAETGSDAGAGTQTAPWRTLQKAADTVAAGDVVTVRPGTYQGFDLRTDGTADAPIVFNAESGAKITTPNAVTTRDGINLEGADYITIGGFTISGLPRAGIRSVTNNHVTLRDNTCELNGTWGIFTGFSNDLLIENNNTNRSQTQHGIYVSNSADRPVLRGNISWGNYACGIHMNGDVSMGGDGMIQDALVENNVIYGNGVGGGSGINGDGVTNSRIQNNLLYDNHASGISLYQIDAAAGATNNVIVNNTVLMAADARWALNIANASTGNTVFNNILLTNSSFRGSISIWPESLPGFASDRNVVVNRLTRDDGGTIETLAQWQASTGQDGNSIVATPDDVFASVATNDYRLATGSPALDRGTATFNSDSAPTFDSTRAVRPSGAGYDIGAYETQVETTPPPSPPPPPPPPPPADTTAPTVTDAQATFTSSSRQVIYSFSEDVSKSIDLSDLRFTNVKNNATLTPTTVTSTSTGATFTFASNVPAGQYRVTLLAGGVYDAAGNHLAADYTFNVSVPKTKGR